MIGIAKNQKNASRARIRELFAARDAAVAARTAGEKRIEMLEEKIGELERSLPGRRQGIKDAEYSWRMAQAKVDVGEASPEDVAAAALAIDAATARLAEAEGKVEATEDLLGMARNQISLLTLAASSSMARPWAAISELMLPEVREAAALINKFYTVEINHIDVVPGDVFHRQVVPLGDVSAIAGEIEKEFRAR